MERAGLAMAGLGSSSGAPLAEFFEQGTALDQPVLVLIR